jgi:myosin-5
MDIIQSKKACEALMKATYGAAFDFIVTEVNESISAQQTEPQASNTCASIGVLDIFGFETFETNNFEQICINYTNEVRGLLSCLNITSFIVSNISPHHT